MKGARRLPKRTTLAIKARHNAADNRDNALHRGLRVSVTRAAPREDRLFGHMKKIQSLPLLFLTNVQWQFGWLKTAHWLQGSAL